MNAKTILAPIRIGLVSIAGQASNVEDEDRTTPTLREWFDRAHYQGKYGELPLDERLCREGHKRNPAILRTCAKSRA